MIPPETLLALDRRHLWHPFTQAATAPDPIVVKSARGARLTAADGREYLDLISSWWVTLHGHGNPVIAEAIARQAGELEQVIFAGFTHAPAVELAARLAGARPARLRARRRRPAAGGRRAADPRRGDDRLRPHRCTLRQPEMRRHARPDLPVEGALRRLPAACRDGLPAGALRGLPRRRLRPRLRPRPFLHRQPAGLRRRAGVARPAAGARDRPPAGGDRGRAPRPPAGPRPGRADAGAHLWHHRGGRIRGDGAGLRRGIGPQAESLLPRSRPPDPAA